jgi:hypothetical protein
VKRKKEAEKKERVKYKEKVSNKLIERTNKK